MGIFVKLAQEKGIFSDIRANNSHSPCKQLPLTAQTTPTHHANNSHSPRKQLPLTMQTTPTHHANNSHSPCKQLPLTAQTTPTHRANNSHSPCKQLPLTMQTTPTHYANNSHSPCKQLPLTMQTTPTHRANNSHSPRKQLPLTAQTTPTHRANNSHSPRNICIEGGHLWVEFLISPDKGIFVNLPDLPVSVPGTEIVLEVGRVTLHPRTDLSLDLLDLIILTDYYVNGLWMENHKLNMSNQYVHGGGGGGPPPPWTYWTDSDQ